MSLVTRTFTSAVCSLAALATLTVTACSSSGSTPDVGTSGGPVTGPADTHCAGKSQETNAAACQATGTEDAGADAAMLAPAHDDAGDMPGMGEYGPTMNNAEGDDDDCKYHVKWSVSPVTENKDVTFTLTLTKKTDGTPATGATPRIEAYLNDTHPAPNTKPDQTPRETSPGVYTITPVQFDASGTWTVRFHFYEECVDLTEDSPHGHAAFFLSVP